MVEVNVGYRGPLTAPILNSTTRRVVSAREDKDDDKEEGELTGYRTIKVRQSAEGVV